MLKMVCIGEMLELEDHWDFELITNKITRSCIFGKRCGKRSSTDKIWYVSTFVLSLSSELFSYKLKYETHTDKM